MPREQPIALGQAISRFLADKRRTSVSTHETIERDFRASAVAARYRDLYTQALAGDPE